MAIKDTDNNSIIEDFVLDDEIFLDSAAQEACYQRRPQQRTQHFA